MPVAGLGTELGAKNTTQTCDVGGKTPTIPATTSASKVYISRKLESLKSQNQEPNPGMQTWDKGNPSC